MTFHEKSAWIMGVLLTLIVAWYTNTVLQASLALGETSPPVLPHIALATIVLVAGAIASHILIATINPEDADDTEDERDRQVLRRAGNIAGYVLGTGAFAGLWNYMIQKDGHLLFHIIVVSLILAQIAEYFLTIAFYRRGE